jgi:hypothetical protein
LVTLYCATEWSYLQYPGITKIPQKEFALFARTGRKFMSDLTGTGVK